MNLGKNERFFIDNSFYHLSDNRRLYTDVILQLRPCLVLKRGD